MAQDIIMNSAHEKKNYLQIDSNYFVYTRFLKELCDITREDEKNIQAYYSSGVLDGLSKKCLGYIFLLDKIMGFEMYEIVVKTYES